MIKYYALPLYKRALVMCKKDGLTYSRHTYAEHDDECSITEDFNQAIRLLRLDIEENIGTWMSVEHIEIYGWDSNKMYEIRLEET